jgi:predicted ATPase
MEAIEHRPIDDLGAMQRTIGSLDATCAQLQNTMHRYFEASHRGTPAAEVIDLVPASRRN